MDYAGVAMRWVQAAPAGGHMPQLNPLALLIDARDIFPDASRSKGNEFLLKNLTVPAGRC